MTTQTTIARPVLNTSINGFAVRYLGKTHKFGNDKKAAEAYQLNCSAKRASAMFGAPAQTASMPSTELDVATKAEHLEDARLESKRQENRAKFDAPTSKPSLGQKVQQAIKEGDVVVNAEQMEALIAKLQCSKKNGKDWKLAMNSIDAILGTTPF
jgi:hypothetical protein